MWSSSWLPSCFFFQAEDGIRDDLVTGVQTCALPISLIIGPTWLLLTLIVVLLVPTVVAHRTGRRSLNRALGVLINAIITLALIGSVILLVTALPSHKEAPLPLLLSGAELWITNVFVFALWYWRIEGGGPPPTPGPRPMFC